LWSCSPRVPLKAQLVMLEAIGRLSSPPEGEATIELPNAIWLAKFFHDAYERLAPQYGYVTRPDTRQFDHESPNGRLMAAVCEELRRELSSSQPQRVPE
jgi:hypothetical protein